jgi:hypothetical protein
MVDWGEYDDDGLAIVCDNCDGSTVLTEAVQSCPKCGYEGDVDVFPDVQDYLSMIDAFSTEDGKTIYDLGVTADDAKELAGFLEACVWGWFNSIDSVGGGEEEG